MIKCFILRCNEPPNLQLNLIFLSISDFLFLLLFFNNFIMLQK